MKLFLLLSALVAVAVQGHPHPEYIVVQDGAGVMRLENVNQEAVPENFFDPAQDIRYFLFTRENPSDPQELFIGNQDSFTLSNFNEQRPTRVLIHGQNGNLNTGINVLVREAYIAAGDFNVIVVDWSIGADTTLYLTARNRVGDVGGYLAMFMQNLIDIYQVDLATIQLVGHNLGAHIAGLAGKNHNGQIGAIVALDASLSMFDINEPGQRVAMGDALYVESIHTNTGQNGFDEPLGDSSFYPNFGNRQPGCGIDVAGNCAHARAIDYFAESLITVRHFWARECERYKDILMEQCTANGVDRKMGSEPIETLARGIYWLTTNSASPFATGIV